MQSAARTNLGLDMSVLVQAVILLQSQAYGLTTSDDSHTHIYNHFLSDGHTGIDSTVIITKVS